VLVVKDVCKVFSRKEKGFKSERGNKVFEEVEIILGVIGELVCFCGFLGILGGFWGVLGYIISF